MGQDPPWSWWWAVYSRVLLGGRKGLDVGQGPSVHYILRASERGRVRRRKEDRVQAAREDSGEGTALDCPCITMFHLMGSCWLLCGLPAS